eukprot:CAMPEP_0176447850 /NCGR_PEP_ID=MMETSP0127-20121128/25326_1 /TAXON_ID=938130 /ORGANISM="Platyophrya macrostoma, Strain WH" /LENGTH=177 /DNA_ID=CAMNT_0017834473 /DNA_START=78 /DNA_END=608 /DNA_ORIENTATION=+
MAFVPQYATAPPPTAVFMHQPQQPQPQHITYVTTTGAPPPVQYVQYAVPQAPAMANQVAYAQVPQQILVSPAPQVVQAQQPTTTYYTTTTDPNQPSFVTYSTMQTAPSAPAPAGPSYQAPTPQQQLQGEQEILPPNWQAAWTATGEKYYVDHGTQTTHWHLPPQYIRPQAPPLNAPP